ncbi:hypothetical protein BGZ65_001915 [Modicella reniformis]|uniref:sn-1-specific diacylglycerol lipase n=1 Tax=Modicella reniformis TaxID=1440133 RepID=A0A9P6J1C3_9FUNG|nr:hypothetical protein BGZ65_001915 [Modicella reniformis]
MTDLVCEYYPYKGGLVHKGIMDNARFVLERSGKDIEAALKKFKLQAIYCIGHSLGAGSSSLLCSLLQDHFANYVIPGTSPSKTQKLEIKAYLFAPPPICTPNLAEEWERTQIAFINENDIVCRLSYGNALDLKELIKIAALENENPVYHGLDSKEKLERILKVLERAQESLRAVNDIPRLVIGGTITYLHKVYEDTPVIENKRPDRSSKFEDWSEDKHTLEEHDSTGQRHSSVTRLSAVLSRKGGRTKHRHASLDSVPGDDNHSSISSSSSFSSRIPKVTPYQPNQPPVRLQGPTSLDPSDPLTSHIQQETGQPPAADSSQQLPWTQHSVGEPIQYNEQSNARELATQRILDDSRKGQASTTQTTHSGAVHDQAKENQAEGEEEEEEEEEEKEVAVANGNHEDYEDEDEHKVYTTQKPRKNWSKKEIRIEFSDKEHFMAIPLRTNWLWHHFPQQYDSRVERALAWAKAQKAKEERKRQRQ